jgi:hypothetical protein
MYDVGIISISSLIVVLGLFTSCTAIVAELLSTLDAYHQQRAIVVMKALLCVLRSIHSWFTLFEVREDIKKDIEVVTLEMFIHRYYACML